MWDDKKLSVEDRIVDIFPDKAPDEISENLSKMKLKHLLSMNSGHSACVMGKMVASDDPVRAFLSEEVPFEPGTHFTYNTGATCMLSCVVEKITGMTLLDFITLRLFIPLGICGVRWNRLKSGYNEGGCGLHVSCDDIAKLGLLYLNKGIWKGRRLLSEEWIDTATHTVSDNSGSSTPDWCSGYGYQFWMNSREGYRGDGAFGQLCVVLPERDMVVAVQAEVGDMQAEIDSVMELIYHLFDNDAENALILPEYMSAKSGINFEAKLSGYENKFYRLNENPLGWSGVYFTYDASEEVLSAVFTDGTDHTVIKAGSGFFIESQFAAKKFKPKLLGFMNNDENEKIRIVSSYAAENGKLCFIIRHLNCPHKEEINFSFEADRLSICIDGHGLTERAASNITGRICKE